MLGRKGLVIGPESCTGHVRGMQRREHGLPPRHPWGGEAINAGIQKSHTERDNRLLLITLELDLLNTSIMQNFWYVCIFVNGHTWAYASDEEKSGNRPEPAPPSLPSVS